MRILVISCLLVITLGCAEGPFDPSYLHPTFQGITPTDSQGALLGPADGNDWRVSLGKTPFPVDRSDIVMRVDPAGRNVSPSGIVPSEFKVYAAYPNPTTAEVTVTLEVPVSCTIYTWVLDRNMNTVRRDVLHASFAGVWGKMIDFSDGRLLLTPDIYRVVYEFHVGEEVLHGYGDVKYITSDERGPDTHQN